MSLENAIALDKTLTSAEQLKLFRSTAFRQPSLIVKVLEPGPYRLSPSGENGIHSSLIQKDDTLTMDECEDDEINELVDEVLSNTEKNGSESKVFVAEYYDDSLK